MDIHRKEINNKQGTAKKKKRGDKARVTWISNVKSHTSDTKTCTAIYNPYLLIISSKD
jgi:hypothetical protein